MVMGVRVSLKNGEVRYYEGCLRLKLDCMGREHAFDVGAIEDVEFYTVQGKDSGLVLEEG